MALCFVPEEVDIGSRGLWENQNNWHSSVAVARYRDSRLASQEGAGQKKNFYVSCSHSLCVVPMYPHLPTQLLGTWQLHLLWAVAPFFSRSCRLSHPSSFSASPHLSHRSAVNGLPSRPWTPCCLAAPSASTNNVRDRKAGVGLFLFPFFAPRILFHAAVAGVSTSALAQQPNHPASRRFDQRRDSTFSLPVLFS